METLRRVPGLTYVIYLSLIIAVVFAISNLAQAETTHTTLHIDTSDIVVSMNGDLPLGQATILDWVQRSAFTVCHYFGRFPVPRLDLRIQGVQGDNIGGTAYGYDQHINIPLGRDVTLADLDDDWVLIHEMVHMGHPDVPEAQKWFKEGIATYVEPIARAQMGNMSANRLWADLVHRIPQGLPHFGDRGLDFTPTWGRTYWGGAMFCLLADVGIRERTGNRKGLQDALRAILSAGGTLDQQWSIRHALSVGDEAVGVPVLTELYERMRSDSKPENLELLWQRLGVEIKSNNRIELSDDAPLAATRQAITTGGN